MERVDTGPERLPFLPQRKPALLERLQLIAHLCGLLDQFPVLIDGLNNSFDFSVIEHRSTPFSLRWPCWVLPLPLGTIPWRRLSVTRFHQPLLRPCRRSSTLLPPRRRPACSRDVPRLTHRIFASSAGEARRSGTTTSPSRRVVYALDSRLGLCGSASEARGLAFLGGPQALDEVLRRADYLR